MQYYITVSLITSIYVHLQALLGDRYGFRPIPSSVPAGEFEALLSMADQLDLGGRDLLPQWYCRDDNALPAQYILQVRIQVLCFQRQGPFMKINNNPLNCAFTYNETTADI